GLHPTIPRGAPRRTTPRTCPPDGSAHRTPSDQHRSMMDTEYEARFCNIDREAITKQLADRGAACVMSRTLMRRIVFKNRDIAERGGWLRLREQGERTFLTYKQT